MVVAQLLIGLSGFWNAVIFFRPPYLAQRQQGKSRYISARIAIGFPVASNYTTTATSSRQKLKVRIRPPSQANISKAEPPVSPQQRRTEPPVLDNTEKCFSDSARDDVHLSLKEEVLPDKDVEDGKSEVSLSEEDEDVEDGKSEVSLSEEDEDVEDGKSTQSLSKEDEDVEDGKSTQSIREEDEDVEVAKSAETTKDEEEEEQQLVSL